MLTVEQRELLDEVSKFRKPTREALFSVKTRPVSILTKQGKKIIEQLLIYDMLLLDKNSDTWSEHACLVFDILSEKGKLAVETMEQELQDRVNGLPMSDYVPQNKALPLKNLGTFTKEDYGFWVVEVKNNLYFSNGKFILRSDPPAGSRILETKPDFDSILQDAEISQESIGRVIGFSYNDEVKSDVIWMEDERVIDCKNLSLHDSIEFDSILRKLDSEILSMQIRIILQIDSVYYDYILRQYPQATFGLLGRESGVGIFNDDEIVGIVMPIRYREIPDEIEKLRLTKSERKEYEL